MDSWDRYALRRFGLKLGMLAVLALMRTPMTFRVNTTLLLIFAGFFDGGIALVRRDKLNDRNFTYWDEAAAFGFMALVSTII